MKKQPFFLTLSILCFAGAGYIATRALRHRYSTDPYSIAQMLAKDPVQLRAALYYAGWEQGEPWCMYFCKACYMLAYPRYAFLLYRLLTGYTQESWQRAEGSHIIQKIITGQLPRRGDILIWQKNDEADSGHAAIVGDRISGNNWEIVEGNNNLWGKPQINHCLREVEPIRKGEHFTQLGMIRMG